MAWTAATRGDYVRPRGSCASDVTDREWALIAPLLPAPRSGGRPRSTCLRRVIDAIFYLLQTGCQWRMPPRDFPPRSTVYGYFRAWIARGVWARLHDALCRRTRELEGREESPTVAHPPGLHPPETRHWRLSSRLRHDRSRSIDSQSVKTSPDARDAVGYDAGKRVKGFGAFLRQET